jgi:hypothetical protein
MGMGPYAGVDYCITSPYVHSNPFAMGNPMPDRPSSYARLYPPLKDFGFGLRLSVNSGNTGWGATIGELMETNSKSYLLDKCWKQGKKEVEVRGCLNPPPPKKKIVTYTQRKGLAVSSLGIFVSNFRFMTSFSIKIIKDILCMVPFMCLYPL